MNDPYRKPGETIPDGETAPAPAPFPGPSKWQDPDWRRFFDAALAGASSKWNGDAAISPETLIVNQAERIADEAFLRFAVAATIR